MQKGSGRPGGLPDTACLEDVHREVDEDPYFVAISTITVGGAQDGVAQTDAQILGSAALHHILQLVEDLALAGTLRTIDIDIGTVDVGEVVAQARNTVLGEVVTVTELPGTLVLTIEIGPEGVGDPDGGAAITHRTLVLVETVLIAGVATVALVGHGEVMRAGSVVGGQAPDIVSLAAGKDFELIVILGAVAAEIQGQGIVLIHRQNIVQVHILTLQAILHIGGIESRTEVVAELIAAAQDLDGLQSATVTTFIALAMLSMEATGMHGQTVDLIGGDHGAGEGFGQQTAVVMAQYRQSGLLIAVAENGIGEARLDGCTSVGNVLLNIAIVIDHEEVDTAGTGAAPAAVQTHGILTKGVNTKADNTLGEAGIEGQNGALTPFHLVVSTVLVVAVHIGIAQEQIETAVLDEALGVGLAGSQRRDGGHQGQCYGAQFVFSHFQMPGCCF